VLNLNKRVELSNKKNKKYSSNPKPTSSVKKKQQSSRTNEVSKQVEELLT